VSSPPSLKSPAARARLSLGPRLPNDPHPLPDRQQRLLQAGQALLPVPPLRSPLLRPPARHLSWAMLSSPW